MYLAVGKVEEESSQFKERIQLNLRHRILRSLQKKAPFVPPQDGMIIFKNNQVEEIKDDERSSNARLGKRQRNNQNLANEPNLDRLNFSMLNSDMQGETQATQRATMRETQANNTGGKTEVSIFAFVLSFNLSADFETCLHYCSFTLSLENSSDFLYSKMKILSWNVCGFGNNTTRNHLQMLIRSHNPDIIFLSETKNKLKSMQ